MSGGGQCLNGPLVATSTILLSPAGIGIDVLRERETIMFEWARGRGLPVAFVLAGGYVGGALDRDGLVDLHRQGDDYVWIPGRWEDSNENEYDTHSAVDNLPPGNHRQAEHE